MAQRHRRQVDNAGKRQPCTPDCQPRLPATYACCDEANTCQQAEYRRADSHVISDGRSQFSRFLANTVAHGWYCK